LPTQIGADDYHPPPNHASKTKPGRLHLILISNTCQAGLEKVGRRMVRHLVIWYLVIVSQPPSHSLRPPFLLLPFCHKLDPSHVSSPEDNEAPPGRLSLGDHVQIVSIDGGWAKLLRGYGFVRADGQKLVEGTYMYVAKRRNESSHSCSLSLTTHCARLLHRLVDQWVVHAS
jgi:hypothetical protein